MVLIIFATAVMTIYQTSPDEVPDQLHCFVNQSQGCAESWLNLHNSISREGWGDPLLPGGLFAAFVAITILSLLNMLIAATHRTSSKVAEVRSNLIK